MQDFLQVDEQYYIPVTSSLAENQGRVLKHNETFAVLDRQGGIRSIGMGNQGLFHGGTRFLSRLQMEVEGKRPVYLSSTIKESNDLLVVDSTNPDLETSMGGKIKGDTLHFFKNMFLWRNCCYQKFHISNYSENPVEFRLSIRFSADYADIFEVRGHARAKRGKLLEPAIEGNQIGLSYRGLDGVLRRTRIIFAPAPFDIEKDKVDYSIQLGPHESMEIIMTVVCEISEAETTCDLYDDSLVKMGSALENMREKACVIETSNEHFNAWLNRSSADLFMMLSETPQGLYPYAGIPWFSTIFGRDGIIVALETLWIYPDIAKGVLRYLAARQSLQSNPKRDAEPGKILHEVRGGEMANLGEIPFDTYYGSIDSTPLFLVLAGSYYERTMDRDLIEEIWPSLERALTWITDYGDIDGDGFIEYEKKSVSGLLHQGWKDSENPIFHSGGKLAEPPIALCEVQGYVYEAKKKAANLAGMLGKKAMATRLVKEAAILKERFQKAFWCNDMGIYALALDGKKRPCRVLSSNMGQCLFTGIADRRHAERIVARIVAENMFNGWGIRTISSSEARYNPMSYHNGSVWPHDNALIALGMDRYGFKEEAVKILSGLFDASLFVDMQRLPELFCGFERRSGEGPTLYPVACSPQSWATASVYMLLQASLGLSVEAEGRNKVIFRKPALPAFLDWVDIDNLRVGDGRLNIRIRRHDPDVSVQVKGRRGDVEVIEIR